MRILHLSDLHAEPVPEVRLPGLMATLERDRDQIAASGADFIVVSGDLTTYGNEHRDHLELARAWLDSLGIPYLASSGNHDLTPVRELAGRPEASYEDMPYVETNYATVFGPDPVVVRDLGELRAVAVNIRDGDPDGTLPVLDEVLSSDDRPVILVGHYPLVPAREPKIQPFFGSEAFIPTTQADLLSVVSRHHNVAVYACGHVHVNSVRPLGEHCTQITAGSLGQGASTYRSYDIANSTLTYSTVFGSGPLEFWPGAPSLEFHLGHGDERTGELTW